MVTCIYIMYLKNSLDQWAHQITISDIPKDDSQYHTVTVVPPLSCDITYPLGTSIVGFGPVEALKLNAELRADYEGSAPRPLLFVMIAYTDIDWYSISYIAISIV